MSLATLLAISAAGGAIYAAAGYLKNRKEGAPFSWGKFMDSCCGGFGRTAENDTGARRHLGWRRRGGYQ